MRLTIVNLFISGEKGYGIGAFGKHPCTNVRQIEPAICTMPHCVGRRQNGGLKRAKRRLSPAEARYSGSRQYHTAILRNRTGAPAVRLSAASMMALASMPWWR